MSARRSAKEEDPLKKYVRGPAPDPPPVLIEAAPKNKLGWDNATVDPVQMQKLEAPGEKEGERIFKGSLP